MIEAVKNRLDSYEPYDVKYLDERYKNNKATHAFYKRKK